jgi:hypothetical protein
MPRSAAVSIEPAAPPAEEHALARAFRDPEGFIHRWHREGHPYPGAVFAALAAVAVLGTLAYGTTLGLSAKGPEGVLEGALLYTAAAALSWAVPLPAVYVLNSLAGMTLRASTVFLASLVTAAWGGLALVAFLPITLLYLLAFPGVNWLALVAHAVVFTLVGFSMACIFGRQVERLEPGRGGGRVWWLWLFVCLKVQLLYSFGLVRFEP